MPNSILDKFNVSIKIIVLIITLTSISISKSVYILLFFSFLLLFLTLLSSISVNKYVELIKNIILILLFILIIYIIIFRNILYAFLFIYKAVLVVLYVKHFNLSVNIQKKLNGVFTILKPLNKFININSLSFNIICFIEYIYIFLNSKEEIMSNYNKNKRLLYSFSMKYNIIPRAFLSSLRVKKIESSLKLKHAKPKYEIINIQSKILLGFFILLFILVIIKEVIL